LLRKSAFLNGSDFGNFRVVSVILGHQGGPGHGLDWN
jgi:hypothetical protein